MNPQNPARRILRRPAVEAKTGLGRTTIYNLEKQGLFPAHFMLTPRCAAWLEEEVDAWISERRRAAQTGRHLVPRDRSAA